MSSNPFLEKGYKHESLSEWTIKRGTLNVSFFSRAGFCCRRLNKVTWWDESGTRTMRKIRTERQKLSTNTYTIFHSVFGDLHSSPELGFFSLSRYSLCCRLRNFTSSLSTEWVEKSGSKNATRYLLMLKGFPRSFYRSFFSSFSVFVK